MPNSSPGIKNVHQHNKEQSLRNGKGLVMVWGKVRGSAKKNGGIEKAHKKKTILAIKICGNKERVDVYADGKSNTEGCDGKKEFHDYIKRESPK